MESVAEEMLTRIAACERLPARMVSAIFPLHGPPPTPLVHSLSEHLDFEPSTYSDLLFVIMCTHGEVLSSASSKEQHERMLHFNAHVTMQVLADLLTQDAAVPDPSVFEPLLARCAAVPSWRPMVLWLCRTILASADAGEPRWAGVLELATATLLSTVTHVRKVPSETDCVALRSLLSTAQRRVDAAPVGVDVAGSEAFEACCTRTRLRSGLANALAALEADRRRA